MESKVTSPAGHAAQIVPISRGHELPPIIGEDPANLIDQFINAQDVSKSSRHTYRRHLGSFMAWIIREGIQKPVREDILACKR